MRVEITIDRIESGMPRFVRFRFATHIVFDYLVHSTQESESGSRRKMTAKTLKRVFAYSSGITHS